MRTNIQNIRDVLTSVLVTIVATVVLLILLSGQSWASPSEEIKRFGLSASLESSSSLHAFDDVNRSLDSTITAIPTYKLSEKLNLSARLSAVQEFEPEARAALSDGSLGISHRAFVLNPFLGLRPALSVTVPLSDDSRRKNSLIASVKAAGRLSLDPSRLGLKRVTSFYELGVSRGVHQFTTAASGAPNTQTKISQWVNISVSLLDRLSLSNDFITSAGITYGGVLKNSFSWSEELSYEFTSALSAAAGLTNEGSTLKSNGVESNVGLLNGESTRGYVSLTYGI